MRTLLLDPPPVVAEFLERRKRLGLDGYDEVWEGTYHVAPMSRSRHGWLQVQLSRILGLPADHAGLCGIGPFNLGAGQDNFRVPDLGYLRRVDPELLYVPTAAVVVEVLSPDDETYEKFPFYAAHKVDEILVIDPEQRRVELYARAGDGYQPADRSGLLGIDAAELTAQLTWE